MFNSSFFKKHYPIQSQTELYEMSEKDRRKLSNWICGMEADVQNWNYREAVRGSRRRIVINYCGDIKHLSQKIEAMNAAEISDEDLSFVNEVLYRHKYILPVSLYSFPIKYGIFLMFGAVLIKALVRNFLPQISAISDSPNITDFVFLLTQAANVITFTGSIMGLGYMSFGAMDIFFDGYFFGGHGNLDYIPVLKYADKTRTKKLKIPYFDDLSLDDTIAKNVLNPIEEAWKLTQDKTTSYHQEYVTTYYSLSPYLEEVADAINAWGKMMKEKALETGNKDEKERILGLFNDQMNGSLGAAIKHVVEQMKAVQRKETQYKADVVAAEQTLQEEKPIHSTEESPFEVLDVMMASEREKSDLIKKYEQPKNKKSKKRKREH